MTRTRAITAAAAKRILCLLASAVIAASAVSCVSVRPARILRKPADLTIVHLTDLHLSTRADGAVTTPWTHRIAIGGYKLHRKCLGKSIALFEQAIELINSTIRPDVVVITGDIVDRGSDRAAFEQASALVRRLQCPVVVVEGDHDPCGKEHPFTQYFGDRDGVKTVNGYDLLFLPYNAPDAALDRLQKGLDRENAAGLRILCLHRMLRTSLLMDLLRRKYGVILLSPRKDELLPMLEQSGGPVLVLCGHSHTNYTERDGNITHVCTSSLAEYPHEMRIVKIRGAKIRTRTIRLSDLEAVD